MADPARVRIVHVITELAIGGSETALARLIEGSDGGRFRHAVVALADGGPIADRLRAAGAEVRALDGRVRPWALLGRLAATLRTLAPDVVHAWLYHPALLTALLRPLRRRGALVWSVRGGLDGLRLESRRTQVVIRATAALSRIADALVYNAGRAREQHEALGYASRRGVVIPNGIDAERFRPDDDARTAERIALGIPPEQPLVGWVGRRSPLKDPGAFVRLAARIGPACPDAAFVVVGRGHLPPIQGAPPSLRVIDERLDLPRLLPALDVLVSTSVSEGFPNVVAEAMACGVPCIGTDVGATADVIGETGRVVPAGDGRALLEATRALLDAGPEARAALGRLARERVSTEFPIERFVSRHEALWDELREADRLTAFEGTESHA